MLNKLYSKSNTKYKYVELFKTLDSFEQNVVNNLFKKNLKTYENHGSIGVSRGDGVVLGIHKDLKYLSATNIYFIEEYVYQNYEDDKPFQYLKALAVLKIYYEC